MPKANPISESLAMPGVRLCLGVTGHRLSNAAYAANEAAIAAAFADICDSAHRAAQRMGDGEASVRLHSLLALGADMMAIDQALSRRWDVVAPLPFGIDLNIAINCRATTRDDALAVMAGIQSSDAGLDASATKMREVAKRIKLFELAEQDALVADLFMATLDAPDDMAAAVAYRLIASNRSATAGRVMIEQSDLLIAIWDGQSSGDVGGTRHTMAVALEQQASVICIDAGDPTNVRHLRGPDALELGGPIVDADGLDAIMVDALCPPDDDQHRQAIKFHTERWHPRSARRFHGYRRIEALFGGGERGRFSHLRATYESPEGIAGGSGAQLLVAARAVPGCDGPFIDRLAQHILGRFAWADGLSTYLSDAYRSGMVANFLLSTMAIIVGVTYLPFGDIDLKWPFAVAELSLLMIIVAITVVGRKHRWHGRWFETRRVAEYLRHAPVLLLLGVARSNGRWPRGSGTRWPEIYARQTLCDLGLPHAVITQPYLRAALDTLLLRHVRTQRDYHRVKAARLTRVHHGLDRLAELLFVLAIVSVTAFLALLGAGTMGWIAPGIPHDLSKLFTFSGVVLPALGGAFASIRYFGDFERFAAISEVTSEKLDGLALRIEPLLADTALQLHYSQVAGLAHIMDDIVISEIESWQSVFAGKNIAVPV
ncbi:MAG: hypothetical protein ABL882_12000 [Sphingopyxis sp.]